MHRAAPSGGIGGRGNWRRNKRRTLAALWHLRGSADAEARLAAAALAAAASGKNAGGARDINIKPAAASILMMKAKAAASGGVASETYEENRHVKKKQRNG
jgi:hypothetical protein